MPRQVPPRSSPNANPGRAAVPRPAVMDRQKARCQPVTVATRLSAIFIAGFQINDPYPNTQRSPGGRRFRKASSDAARVTSDGNDPSGSSRLARATAPPVSRNARVSTGAAVSSVSGRRGRESARAADKGRGRDEGSDIGHTVLVVDVTGMGAETSAITPFLAPEPGFARPASAAPPRLMNAQGTECRTRSRLSGCSPGFATTSKGRTDECTSF